MKKLLPRSIRNPKGFTLIELLIVVTIIAVLSVIGAVVYTGIQKNARDASRKAAINSVADAMEASYSKTTAGSYDALALTMFSSSTVPTDPQNGKNGCGSATAPCKYCSRSAAGACAGTDTTVAVGAPATGATYTVCANLENGTNQYYCRSNSQ